MLLELFQWLAQDTRAFNVFNYITLRAVLATMTALTIAFLLGPALIRWLAAKKIGQAVRTDGPQTHLAKSGTPTMGGALILLSLGIATLLWADLTNRFVWIVLIVTFGFGAVGWVDDWRKVVYRNPKGLSAKAKFFWQTVIGIVAAVWIAFSISAPNTEKTVELILQWIGSGFAPVPMKTDLIVPFFKSISYPLGIFGFMILTYLVIVGSSNAVNLTDGLDGLAILPTVMVGAALGIFAYVAGHAGFSKYLLLPYIPGAGELTVFCGALALGAALGTVAVITRQEIVLFVMGGVFVAETISVMLQVGWFKYTKWRTGIGQRILLMAPLHHHYEQVGWKETQVVVRFWIITILLVLVGLSTLKIR